MAVLYGSTSPVQVIGTDNQPGIRSDINQVDINPRPGDATGNLPEYPRAVLHFQDQDFTLATHLKASLLELPPCSTNVLYQNVYNSLAFAGKPTTPINVDAGLAQGLAYVS
jgi:hypothetical protein